MLRMSWSASASLTPQQADQVKSLQDNLTSQWEQILLNEGNSNPFSSPNWPQIQVLIANQVNNLIKQLGGTPTSTAA